MLLFGCRFRCVRSACTQLCRVVCLLGLPAFDLSLFSFEMSSLGLSVPCLSPCPGCSVSDGTQMFYRGEHCCLTLKSCPWVGERAECGRASAAGSWCAMDAAGSDRARTSNKCELGGGPADGALLGCLQALLTCKSTACGR